jgi:hypothetical protein
MGLNLNLCSHCVHIDGFFPNMQKVWAALGIFSVLPKTTWPFLEFFNAARSFQALYLSLKKVFICAQAFWAFRKIPDA